MSRLVQRIAFSSVLVHMTFGCCVHHAHGEAVRHCDKPDVVSCFPHEHCDSCAYRSSEQGESDHHGCGELSCVFVRPERRVGPRLVPPPTLHALASSTSASFRLSPRHGLDIPDLGSVFCCLPVRLHLLNQILLI
jgi:hypothetical protein